MNNSPELPKFEEEIKEKPKRKAVTLYLNSENYKFVKGNMKGKSISQFIDEVLVLVMKSMKEQKNKQMEKESDTKKEGK